MDLTSKDGQEIMSTFDKLDEVLSALTAVAVSEQASPTKCGKNIVVAC